MTFLNRVAQGLPLDIITGVRFAEVLAVEAIRI